MAHGLQPHGRCSKSSVWSHSTRNPPCPIPFTKALISEASAAHEPIPCRISAPSLCTLPCSMALGVGWDTGCSSPSPATLFCCYLLSWALSSASKKFGGSPACDCNSWFLLCSHYPSKMMVFQTGLEKRPFLVLTFKIWAFEFVFAPGMVPNGLVCPWLCPLCSVSSCWALGTQSCAVSDINSGVSQNKRLLGCTLLVIPKGLPDFLSALAKLLPGTSKFGAFP